MSEHIKDGGDAFPGAVAIAPSGDVYHGFSGMSLRDYFAAKAMQGFCANPDTVRSRVQGTALKELLVERSYEIADAMLKAREAKS